MVLSEEIINKIVNSTFQRFDLDDNGTLDVNEAVHYIETTFKSSVKMDYGAIAKAIDKDGSKTITKEELKQFFRTHAKETH